jgi:hypothetical protein
MISAPSTLPDDPQKLQQLVHSFEKENTLLREQVRVLADGQTLRQKE